MLQKGTKLAVNPIRDPKHIAAISNLLAANPRDYLLYTLGINTGLRTMDVLKLTAGQLRGLPTDSTVWVTETKTKKKNYFIVNLSIVRALSRYFKAYPNLPDDAYLIHTTYAGKADHTRHLGSQRAGDLIQGWCKAVGCNGGRYGAHTLRKTWGYQMRTQWNTDWALITRRYGHSHPSITAVYLGVEDSEVMDCLKTCIN